MCEVYQLPELNVLCCQVSSVVPYILFHNSIALNTSSHIYSQSPEPKLTGLFACMSSMIASMLHGSYLYPGG